VTVPAFKVDGQKMGVFAGETMSIESLLYGTLVDSANDAAEVLARVYPGGRDAFIAYMNFKAQSLGMIHTTFRNPTGLDEFGHLSSAHDMTLLGEEIMRKPALRQIVGTTSASVTSANGKSVHYFKATNMLLTTVPGVEGIKTGWTEAAHENLVTYVNRDHHPIIIALYGSDDRFGETKNLIEWIYGTTSW
jgi:D-alanyl-D-alanine carboxypeptidase